MSAPGEPASETAPGEPANGIAPWVPANETERELARAVETGDQQTYFRVIGTAPLFLPQFLGDDGETGQRFLTANLFGHTFLPVFTSVEAMVARVSGVADGYTTTNYPELSRKWPNPDWRLALNPGTPIDAYVAVDTVAGAAVGDVMLPTAVEAILEEAGREEAGREGGEPDGIDSGPAVAVDAALAAAAAAGDGEAYLRALLEAIVIVPTAAPVADSAALLEPDFPWRPSGDAGNPAIDVYTSRQMFEHAHRAGVPAVEAALAFVVAVWPDGYAMAVNPGAQSGVVLPADQVRTLLFLDEDPDGPLT